MVIEHISGCPLITSLWRLQNNLYCWLSPYKCRVTRAASSQDVQLNSVQSQNMKWVCTFWKNNSQHNHFKDWGSYHNFNQTREGGLILYCIKFYCHEFRGIAGYSLWLNFKLYTVLVLRRTFTMSKFTVAIAHTGILANTKFIPNLYWLGQLFCFLWSSPCIIILPTNVSVAILQIPCPLTQINPGLLISVSLVSVPCSHLSGCDLSSHNGPMSHQTYPVHCLMEHWSNNHIRMSAGVTYAYLAGFLYKYSLLDTLLFLCQVSPSC